MATAKCPPESEVKPVTWTLSGAQFTSPDFCFLVLEHEIVLESISFHTDLHAVDPVGSAEAHIGSAQSKAVVSVIKRLVLFCPSNWHPNV
jgi:hypothetical protein